MKAILYSISIVDGYMDIAHGVSHSIYEIHIPKYKLFFNNQGLWKYHNGRYKGCKKIKTIEIDDKVAENLKYDLIQRLEAEKICKMILNREVKKNV